MGVLRTRCGAVRGWATGGRAGGKVHGALGGKLSRSLRSLRPIAAASVVAGPRRFAEGAWTHPVPMTDKPTHRPPRRFDHTQDQAPRGGWTTRQGRAAREIG